MTEASEILAELHARGVRTEPRPHGGVRLVPAGLIDPPLLARIRAHKTELIARIHAAQKKAEVDRPARANCWKPLPPIGAPAYSILETCRRHGVELAIDDTGHLVVGNHDGKADQATAPWPSLLMALEAHCDAVRDLVSCGWTLKSEFPKQCVA